MRLGGTTLIERVIASLRGAGATSVHVATSVSTPRTQELCGALGVPVLETSGRGYVADVRALLRRFPAFVTVSADLPFLRPYTLRPFLAQVERKVDNWAGVVPENETFPRFPGRVEWEGPEVSGSPTRLVGINVVAKGGADESRPYLFHDPWVAINVNTREDLRWCRRHLAEYARAR